MRTHVLKKSGVVVAAAALLSVGLAVAAPAAGAAETTTMFSYTGVARTFVVPAGVTQLSVEMCGASGAAVALEGGNPGLGARVTSAVSVTPGETLRIRAGGAGLESDNGGFNGGGSAGGGGASDVRRSGGTLAQRVVVAGGGGSAGVFFENGIPPFGFPGGHGGLVGGNGGAGSNGGGGGTQTAGGAGGTAPFPVFNAGLPGTLGNGGNVVTQFSQPPLLGGGGGGLYAGGAGSSYVLPGLLVEVFGGGGGSSLGNTVTAGSCTGNGWVSLTYDPTPVVITPGAAVVTEGNTGSVVAQVPIQLSAPARGAVSIDWTTLDVTGQGYAKAGADFISASGTLVIPSGAQSGVINITVLGDNIHELPFYGGEWGYVALSNPSANAKFGTGWLSTVGIFIILDDDPLPTITPGVAGVIEGNTGFVDIDVPVRLSNPSGQTITVDWATYPGPGVGGLAEGGLDFVAANGTLTFAPGQTSKTIRLRVLGDTIVEPPLYGGEWALISFTNLSSTAQFGTSILARTGVVIIFDDDV